MEMTLEQYILNPMGKNNAVMNASTREIMRKTYIHKFDNLLLRESGYIKYTTYYDKKNNNYWIHVKVPSETVKNFYYDVVFKFSSTEKTALFGEDLFKCNVKFYSNDPAFVYTYAHVFSKNGLFIKELGSKMCKQALKREAKEKNPNNVVGYVKTIYFAYLLMQNKKLNKKSRFDVEVIEFSLDKLLNNITSADIKIMEREREGKKVSKKKKIAVDSQTLKNIKSVGKDVDLGNLQVSTTKRIKNIKNIQSNKSTKSGGSIKRK